MRKERVIQSNTRPPAYQWLKESIGGRPAAAARWSVGSPPAMPSTKVEYQSHTVMSSFEVVPRTAGGSAPPETNALTLTPPCQFECLPPFNGQLFADPKGPPLLREARV